MTKLEPVLIFLSILSDKLECGVYEFFIDDDKKRKNFVYKLIDEIKENEYLSWKGYIDVETGSAEMSIDSFDHFYGMTTEFGIPTFHNNMSLTMQKDIYDDSDLNYTISFGSLYVFNDTKYDYELKGAYLLEEKEGKLKDFVESRIQDHPQWKE